MELNATAVEHIATVLKVDIEALKTALTTPDAKVDEIIPTSIKVFLENDYNTLIDNVQKEGKMVNGVLIGGYENGKKAEREMTVKNLKRTHNIENNEIKTIDDVLSVLVEKAKGDSGKSEPEAVKELKKEKEQLQILAQSKDKEIADLISKNETTIKQAAVKGAIERVVSSLNIDAPDSVINGQRELVIDKAMQKYRIENEDGRSVVYDNSTGVKMVDSLQNPLPIEVVITNFAKGYVSLKGSEGGRGAASSKNNNQSGSEVGNIKNKVDLENYLRNKGVSPTSQEATSIMLEVYKLNPDFK